MANIGPYQILELLQGGPRRLYRVRAADGRVLALKAVPVEGITPDVRERFNREAAISKELDHPNLVKVYDSGEADGFLYQVMELLEGVDLSKVLAERRPLSWDQKLSLMEQVCEGLEYAHGRNLIHRDIKPANLFLENSGRLRVLDFGMARVQDSSLTRAGMAVGTLTYMAPEQIRGETCTTATDVFAAGIVFYELATGKHPFAAGGMDIAKILTAVLFQPPASLKGLAPDAPDGLDLVLNKALEKDTARRLQNATDLKQALSLCRITLKLRPPAPSAEAPAGPGAAPAAEPIDLAKTRVVPRSARPAPSPPQERPPSPGAASPAPKPAPKVELTFCPACTHGNPKGATTCARCGQPLVAAGLPPAESQDRWLQWAAMGVIAAGVLLLLYLILKGMWK